MEKFDLGLNPIFGPTFVYAGRVLAPEFRLIEFHPSLGFAPPARARTKKSLLVSSLIHYKMGNHIYTFTSLYKFSIWDIPFPLQFSNSMGLLWATIFHSPINHFGYINIQNWSPHEEEQWSTLIRQKSLVNPIYFNAPKSHITQF